MPAFVKVIAFAPAVTLAVESASIAPLCVTAPLATNVNAPVASEAATSIALASVMLTAAPEKSRLPKFAVVESPKVTSNPADTIVPNPATVTAPLSVSAPPVVTVRF